MNHCIHHFKTYSFKRKLFHDDVVCREAPIVGLCICVFVLAAPQFVYVFYIIQYSM